MLRRQHIIHKGPGPRSRLVRHVGLGCLLLPRSATGTLFIGMRPEARFTYAPFGDSVLGYTFNISE